MRKLARAILEEFMKRQPRNPLALQMRETLTFHDKDLVPDGYYAVVEVRLERIGATPQDRDPDAPDWSQASMGAYE
jgi:hypothetical protein